MLVVAAAHIAEIAASRRLRGVPVARQISRSFSWRGWLIGGLTAAPVVAVPTSVGYGSALDGVTALLAMHASCASGVTVVGIDNGFGAACAIARMLP